ncbi:hypothetical protein D3C72_1076950 [compost metagenome]
MQVSPKVPTSCASTARQARVNAEACKVANASDVACGPGTKPCSVGVDATKPARCIAASSRISVVLGMFKRCASCAKVGGCWARARCSSTTRARSERAASCCCSGVSPSPLDFTPASGLDADAALRF